MDRKVMTRKSELHSSWQFNAYCQGPLHRKVRSPLADPVFLFTMSEILAGVTRKSVSEVGPGPVPNKK